MKRELEIGKFGKRQIVIWSSCLALLLIASMFFYYSSEVKSMKHEASEHLQSISELIINQVENWRHERVGDAIVLAKSPLIRDAMERWIHNPADHVIKEKLLERLNLFKVYFNYENIYLVTPQAKVLLSVDPSQRELGPELRKYLTTEAFQKDYTIHDFYFCTVHERVHLEIISPIRDYSNKIVSLIILQVNPDENLYKILQSWPATSKTTEALIVRREGDDVVFLNRLRFDSKAALKLKIPIAKQDIPAVRAAMGEKGVFEGRDYRGVKVISYISEVPNSPWFLVAKQDSSEIFADLQFRVVMLVLLAVLMLLFVIGMMYLWYIQRQRKVFEELYEKEKYITQTQEEFRTTLYSIGDAVITTNRFGHIRQMNLVAEKLTGWSETEACGRDLTEVFQIENEETGQEVENPVQRVLKEGKVIGLANHTVLVSKLGERRAIADSGAPIRNEHDEITGVVLVFRDQTDERHAEQVVRESEARFRALFENMVEGVALHTIVFDENGEPVNYRLIDVNEQFCAILGIQRKAAVGTLATELYQVSEAPYLQEYARVAREKKSFFFETYFQPMDKYFEISVAPWLENGFTTIFLNITERKRAQKLLEQSNQLMALHYRNTPLGVIEWDLNNRVTVWNPGAERIFGFSEEEAVGKFAAELIISPEQKKSSEETWARLVDGSGGTRRTTENITRDGRLRIIDWYNAPLRDENGVIHGVASLCHDITENVTAQNALKASEEQFRGLYENVDIGLYRSTPQGVVLMANKTLVHMLGYGSFEEIAMMNLETDGYDTPADRNTFKALMERDGVVTGFEVRLRRKDGSLIYARENSKAIRDEGGTVLFYDGSIENISDRKKAEDHVQKLLKAVEQSPVSIVITNLLGQIEYVNPKFTEVTGYSFEEAFNQNPRILKSGLLPGEAYKEMWETITAGNIWRGELPNKKKNGDIYWELVSISPLKNDHGEITHFIAVKEDITERKQLIHELIQAKDRAEEMNKIKSNFFSNMSHELRTPLIGILGYSEILQDSLSSSSEYHEMASIINSAGRRLLETLNMILSISKLESATLEANRKPQNICEIIKEVYNLYLQAASNKGLMLNMNFDQDEIYCNIDGKLFFEVINNLVNNAIKYTDFGAIWLGVEVNDGTVTIDVGDTGIGIPEDKQPIIWEAFRQVSEGFGRSFEGTGLGLTITKKYVELMGGEIALNSKVSVGSVFHVSFPIIDKTTGHKIGSVKHAEPKPPIQVENRPATAKVHLLIVEDDEVVISLIVAMLAGEYYVECCTTAADALQKVQERVYDGILMDINLRKGMDGVQLTQLIRQMPAYRHTPIIACTAYAMDQDKEDFLTQGMSHYLSKPFGRKELLDLLQEVFHK